VQATMMMPLAPRLIVLKDTELLQFRWGLTLRFLFNRGRPQRDEKTTNNGSNLILLLWAALFYAWLQLLVKTPNNGIAASNTNTFKKCFCKRCQAISFGRILSQLLIVVVSNF
jgi:hypothetical protein